MARGWGNAPPDLKGTLGTLLRTTLIQLGSLRDAAVRELRVGGRELASRAPSLSGSAGSVGSSRTEVLASLGEIIYELARSGELDLDDFPELAGAITELEAIDNELGARSPIARAAPGGEAAVWRPRPSDYDSDGNRQDDADASAPEAEAARPARPTRRGGQGHIAFVADDRDDEGDLAEYMHEDDVPRRDS